MFSFVAFIFCLTPVTRLVPNCDEGTIKLCSVRAGFLSASGSGNERTASDFHSWRSAASPRSPLPGSRFVQGAGDSSSLISFARRRTCAQLVDQSMAEQPLDAGPKVCPGGRAKLLPGCGAMCHFFQKLAYRALFTVSKAGENMNHVGLGGRTVGRFWRQVSSWARCQVVLFVCRIRLVSSHAIVASL